LRLTKLVKIYKMSMFIFGIFFLDPGNFPGKFSIFPNPTEFLEIPGNLIKISLFYGKRETLVMRKRRYIFADALW